MFRVLVKSELMVWHRDNKSTNGLVQHVVNSKAWAHIDALWPKFAIKPLNVRLGLVVDKVNPYGEKNSNWSTWPIFLFIYNLPPWLVMKKFFVVLTLWILIKESMKMHNYDVYMQPLIDKLQKLWKGVVAYDVLRDEGHMHFTLQTILMWTIHEYPTYGLVFGCVHQGYKACVSCGPNVTFHRSLKLGKVVYEGFHHWLPINHPYWRN